MVLIMGNHWYTASGETAHGSGIKVARAEGLLASVTTVMGTMAKPFIERWKREQVLLAALSAKRTGLSSDIQKLIEGLEAIISGGGVGLEFKKKLISNGVLSSYMNFVSKSKEIRESDEDFSKRILDKAEEEGSAAALIGTAVHDCFEKYMDTGIAHYPHKVIIDEKITWEVTRKVDGSPYKIVMNEVYSMLESRFDLSTAKSEMVVIIPSMKLGGKIDLLAQDKQGEWWLIDFKTQGVKTGKSFNKYIDWIMQLSGYQEAIKHWMIKEGISKRPKINLASIAISSNEDYPKVKFYHYEDEDDIYNAYTMLSNCAVNFYLEKKHNPPSPSTDRTVIGA